MTDGDAFITLFSLFIPYFKTAVFLFVGVGFIGGFILLIAWDAEPQRELRELDDDFDDDFDYATNVTNREAVPQVRPEPSSLGEFIILAFAQKKDAEGITGDLAELFDRDLASGMSPQRVRFRYWGRLLRSIGPQIWTRAKNIGLIGLMLTLFNHVFKGG